MDPIQRPSEALPRPGEIVSAWGVEAVPYEKRAGMVGQDVFVWDPAVPGGAGVGLPEGPGSGLLLLLHAANSGQG